MSNGALLCQVSYPLRVQYRPHRLNRQLAGYNAGTNHCGRHRGSPRLFQAHRMLHAHCWLNLHQCIDDTTFLNFANSLKVVMQLLHSTVVDGGSIDRLNIAIVSWKFLSRYYLASNHSSSNRYHHLLHTSLPLHHLLGLHLMRSPPGTIPLWMSNINFRSKLKPLVAEECISMNLWSRV